jgi:hypothetical protein
MSAFGGKAVIAATPLRSSAISSVVVGCLLDLEGAEAETAEQERGA